MASKFNEHFSPFSAMPTIDSTTTLRDTFDKLAHLSRSGFVLLEHGRPLYYISGKSLAEQLISNEIGELIDCNYRDKRVQKLLGEGTAFPIERETLQPGADIESFRSGLRVFPVKQNNILIGWVLNHEFLLQTFTGRIIFICAQGHRNIDPDNGTCGVCPAELVRTELEN